MTDDILVVAYVGEGEYDRAQDVVAELGRDYLASPPEPGNSWDFSFDSPDLFERFMAAWVRAGFDRSEPFVRWSRTYDHSELLGAPLLHFAIDRQPKGEGGPTYGTRYDLAEACPRCGTGARQSSPLVLDARRVEKKGTITETLSRETLVSAELAGALAARGFSGVEFVPAESTHPERPLPWVQLLVRHKMPRMHPDTRGIITERQCPSCRRDGHFHTVTTPEEAVYDASGLDLERLPDFVRTWEHFGNSVLTEPFRESVLATPLVFVKPRVYEMLREHGVRGMQFTPVRLV